MDFGEIVFLSIISIIGLLVLIVVISPKSKKGDDSPVFLATIFSSFVELLDAFPFNQIFEMYSNDGSEIIYKEKTKSRNVFLSIERYKIKLLQKDNTGMIIFSAEIDENVDIGISEYQLINMIHDLYVLRFKV